MALVWVLWEYTVLVMNDIQLAYLDRWISFMACAVYSHITLNAIQYYINTGITLSYTLTISMSRGELCGLKLTDSKKIITQKHTIQKVSQFT